MFVFMTSAYVLFFLHEPIYQAVSLKVMVDNTFHCYYMQSLISVAFTVLVILSLP